MGVSTVPGINANPYEPIARSAETQGVASDAAHQTLLGDLCVTDGDNISRIHSDPTHFHQIDSAMPEAVTGAHSFSPELPIFSNYRRALELQGASTAKRAFLSSPIEWIRRDTAALLKIRSTFGVVSEVIFAAIKRNYPEGCPKEVQTAIDNDEIWALGLLVKEGVRAFECARLYKTALTSLRELCDQCGRPDAFLASTTLLSGSLLREHADTLLQLASIRPDKLPDIVRNLTPELILEFRDVLQDICTHASNGIGPAIDRLRLLRKDDVDLARALVPASGIFASKALEARGSRLFIDNPQAHLQTIAQYGPAYWGLAMQFRERLPEQLEIHRSFIEQALDLTTSGAGKFFESLPSDKWNDRGLAIARRHRAASGYVIELWKRLNYDPGANEELEGLIELNQKMFGLTWINRFVSAERGSINYTLLRTNIENCQARQDQRATALYVGTSTDPLNSLSSSTSLRLLSEMSKKLRLFVSETGNKYGPSEYMRKICEDPKYGAANGSKRLIDGLILGAHSDGHSLQWDGSRHTPTAGRWGRPPHEEYFLSSEDIDIFRGWADFLAPNARIILHACSTLKFCQSRPAIGHAIADTLRRIKPDIEVLGLTKPGDIYDFALDDRGIPREIFWRSGYCWR